MAKADVVLPYPQWTTRELCDHIMFDLLVVQQSLALLTSRLQALNMRVEEEVSEVETSKRGLR